MSIEKRWFILKKNDLFLLTGKRKCDTYYVNKIFWR